MRNEKRQKSTTFPFATIGAQTSRGGTVTQASTRAAVGGVALARVGDTVTYPDGTEATIIDGAGSAAVCEGRALALVGSHLSNGDKIARSVQDGTAITVREGEPIPGLFDPAFVPPAPAKRQAGAGHA